MCAVRVLPLSVGVCGCSPMWFVPCVSWAVMLRVPSPLPTVRCCAALCWSGALASCCSFGLCFFWRLVPSCVAVCCAVSFGVLRCGIVLLCWVRGVLCCCELCCVLLCPVVLCQGASCVLLCGAVLARLRRAPVLCSVASVMLDGVLWYCLWFLCVPRWASLPVVVPWQHVGALASLAGLVGALLLLVVCLGALLPSVVSCGAVCPCGAVLQFPAVCLARLLVFVCSVYLLNNYGGNGTCNTVQRERVKNLTPGKTVTDRQRGVRK